MKKTAFLSDVVFTFFVGFILSLVFFRYLRLATGAAFILAVLCGVLSAIGVGAILSGKRKTYFLKKSDEAQKQKLLFHLALLSDDKKTEFFQNVFSQNGATARFGRLRLQTEKNFYTLKFSFSPVCCDDVVTFSRIKTKKQKQFLCNLIEDDALALCSRLNIQVQTGEQVYAFLKRENALPTEYLGDKAVMDKKRRLRLCFSKRNGKRFLVGGVLLFLSSFLTPFPYYYILFGSILTVSAVLIRIFGYE